MINRNLSGVFQGNVAGVEEGEYSDPSQEYNEQMERVAHNGELHALAPINFEDKIMGGRNTANFMRGKMPELPGMGFNQRVNRLTGKGERQMEDNYNTEQPVSNVLSGSDDPVNKVNQMLGGMGASSGDKMNMLLGSVSSKKVDMSSYLGSRSKGKKSTINPIDYLSSKEATKSDDVVAKMLGKSNSKEKKKPSFDLGMNMNFGPRAVGGFGMNTNFSNANKMLAPKKTAKSKQHADDVLKKGLSNNFTSVNLNTNIKNMFGTMGNPERTAKKRMAQQKGLPMFGDYDRDGLMNIVDCDPLDYMKQGEQHNLGKYMGDGSNQEAPKTQPDSMSVVQETVPDMGNFKITPETAVDYNKDGKVDSKDVSEMNELSPEGLFKFAQEGLNTATDAASKKRHLEIIKNLSKTLPGGQDFYKYKKDHDRLSFEKEKYADDKKLRQSQASNKASLSEQQFAFNKSQQEFNNALTLEELDLKRSKYERDQQLKEADIKSRNKNNEKVMFENEMKSAGNFLGSLVSPGDSLNNLPRMASIDGAGSGQGISQMSGGTGSGEGIARMSSGVGNNPYAMAEMIGESGMRQSFSSKVYDSVGTQTQSKSFAEKVNDSVTKRKPEEVVAEERQRREEQQMVQPQAPQQPQMYSPQQQVQRVQPQAPQQMGAPGTLPIERRAPSVDWDHVSPEQAAPIDPQYARYMAESKDAVTYRRGPYKKTRY
jgi:hypothetical protein